jgi:hypothetical protein
MCGQFTITTPENFLERCMGRSEMFVLKMGVNQSRVLRNFLITIICRLLHPTDALQPVYSYTFLIQIRFF